MNLHPDTLLESVTNHSEREQPGFPNFDCPAYLCPLRLESRLTLVKLSSLLPFAFGFCYPACPFQSSGKSSVSFDIRRVARNRRMARPSPVNLTLEGCPVQALLGRGFLSRDGASPSESGKSRQAKVVVSLSCILVYVQ
jgi:hypothetical protein